ncbi:hypothetical protein AJ78_07889, partial [Emergomyces pasteurianus Ep9510]
MPALDPRQSLQVLKKQRQRREAIVPRGGLSSESTAAISARSEAAADTALDPPFWKKGKTGR